jgi:hypothetical protein
MIGKVPGKFERRKKKNEHESQTVIIGSVTQNCSTFFKGARN